MQTPLCALGSVLGHRGMRGRADATFPHPSSRPKAGHRIRYPVPVTCLRKTTHGVCMMQDKNGEGHRPTHHPVGRKSHRMMDTFSKFTGSRTRIRARLPDCPNALLPDRLIA